MTRLEKFMPVGVFISLFFFLPAVHADPACLGIRSNGSVVKLTKLNKLNCRREALPVSKQKTISLVRWADPNEINVKTFNLNHGTKPKGCVSSWGLTTVLTSSRMVPNIIPGTGGQVNGFRLVQFNKDSLFDKAGFSPGDIIIDINGFSGHSPAEMMTAMSHIKASGNVVKIMRANHLETLKFDCPNP